MKTKTTWLRLLALMLGALIANTTTAASVKENWSKQCSRCHGDDGIGNTKMGRKLHIKNLTSPGVQTRLTDDRIREAVRDGVQSDDGKEEMPPFKEKLTEAERNDLIPYVRSLGAKTKS